MPICMRTGIATPTWEVNVSRPCNRARVMTYPVEMMRTLFLGIRPSAALSVFIDGSSGEETDNLINVDRFHSGFFGQYCLSISPGSSSATKQASQFQENIGLVVDKANVFLLTAARYGALASFAQ
jgi:hypothetical protein